jgi:hypothetical protein
VKKKKPRKNKKKKERNLIDGHIYIEMQRRKEKNNYKEVNMKQ